MYDTLERMLQIFYKYPYLIVIIASGSVLFCILLPLVLLCHRMCRKKLVVYRPTPTQVNRNLFNFCSCIEELFHFFQLTEFNWNY